MQEEITNEELIRLYNIEKEKKNIYQAEQILKCLIEKNHGFIERRISIWSVYKNDLSYHEKEELCQLSEIAIWQAAEAFDATRGNKFITYAGWRIDSKIRDWFRDEHLIQIPDIIQSYCTKYKDLIERYQQDNNGLTPSEDYIQKMLDIGEKTLQSIKDAQCISEIIRADDRDNTGNSQIEKIADDNDILLNVLIQENADEFKKIVWKLKNRDERRVIIEHFYNDMDYVDIAELLEVSKQRINTIKNNAFKHLREMPEVIHKAREMGIKPLDL